MKNVFVISDLHIGGRPHKNTSSGKNKPGSQINYSYQQLTTFIDWIASGKACQGEVELVINGDIVDFLMDDDYEEENYPCPWIANEKEAINKLEKIIDRSRENQARGPFDAMKDLLAAGHRLTYILGNHDIELSLPKVRKKLSSILESEKKDFKFIYDGEAYVRGSLLIEHGNRYDRFNVIDHSGLRQERSVMSRGFSLLDSKRINGRYQPPAGSILVTEILNKIKEKYRFLDLLKPETSAVIPFLLVLHPKLEYVLAELLAVVKVSSRWVSSGMRTPAEPRRASQLNANHGHTDLTLSELMKQLLNEDAQLFQMSKTFSASQLSVTDKWDRFKSLSNQILGYISNHDNLFSAWSREDLKRKQLLSALKVLQYDRSFDLNYENPEYLDAASIIAQFGNFSTIIFGHTHLPKQVDIIKSNQTKTQYINTGTWADIMSVPPEIYSDPDTARRRKVLDRFVKSLESNQLDDYVVCYLSYAWIVLDKNDHVKNANLFSFVNEEKYSQPPLCNAEG